MKEDLKDTWELVCSLDPDYQKIDKRERLAKLSFLKDDNGKTYVVNLNTGGKYRVYETEDNSLFCSCPAWKFSRPVKNFCKHLAFVMKNSKKVEYLDKRIADN